MEKFGQEVSCKQFALIKAHWKVRVTAEHKGSHAHVHVAVQLGWQLIRIADDGTRVTAAC